MCTRPKPDGDVMQDDVTESPTLAVEQSVSALKAERDYARLLLGELIDALSDEVRYEVSQSSHVIDRIEDACRELGGPYEGYIGGWL